MYQDWLDEGFARPGARRTRETFEIAATCHLQVVKDEAEKRAAVDAMKPFAAAVITPEVIDPDFRVRVVALDSAARAGRLTPGECNEANLTGIGTSMAPA